MQDLHSNPALFLDCFVASLLAMTAVKAEKLTQVAAAKRLGIAQPDLSSLLRGRVKGYSIERLMRLLTRFGQDVEVLIRPQTDAAGAGKISVAA